MKLRYSSEELLAEAEYARPHRAGKWRLHGGFDAQGRYLSPRSVGRRAAIDAWTHALRKRGGDLLPADSSMLAGDRYPSEAQQKLLLQSGLGQTFWNSMTITGLIEARGAMLAEVEFPDFQVVVEEDVGSMALGHLNKGMLRAHGIDEGGEPERGIGGHDAMWFAARDLAFGETDWPMPEVPESIGRPEQPGRLAPGLPPAIEQTTLFLMNLLLIEFRAENLFAFNEQLLRDPELFTGRRADAEQAAELVDRIRQDERIHVESLRLYLGELENSTLRLESGERVPGREVLRPLFEGVVHWFSIEQPKLARDQQREILRARILGHSDGDRILREFESLGAD